MTGMFRAFEKMDRFSQINFVSYFLIVLPVTWIFVFDVGTHVNTVDNKTLKGLGEIGTWYAFIIGLGFQLCMQILHINKLFNWNQISE